MEAHTTTPVAAELKDAASISVEPVARRSSEGFAGLEGTSTAMDQRHMRRLGMKQLFERQFNSLKSFFFLIIALGTWQFTAFSMTPGLTDGGRAGIIWCNLWNFFGFLPVTLSLAEMASMAPTAGCQYSWVSEFAPAKYQKVLSFYTGWFSTLAYQAGNAQGVFLGGLLIQTIILINNEDYSFASWQGTLLVLATIVVTYLSNAYGSRFFSNIQTPVFVLSMALYVVMMVAIWVEAPKASVKEVFTTFDNAGGWSSMGLTVLAGQLSGIYNMVGLDTIAHMSEEVQDASRNVPLAMVSAYFICFVINFFLIITVCFGINNLPDALKDSTTYPVLYVLKNSMSVACLSAFIVGIILSLYFSNINYLAAVSRDLFAFARDRGIPFSGWTQKVHSGRHVPQNALLVTSALSIIMSVIYIGSTTAFYAILSLFVVSILQCYMFSIGSVLWRRIYFPETLPKGYWSLGRWGIATNSAALIWMVWAFFWSFWPQYTPFAADTFNWASVLFAAVFLIATAWYFFKARHTYRGPLERIEGRTLGKDDISL